LFIGEDIETVLAGVMAPHWPATGTGAALRRQYRELSQILAGIECLTVMIDHDLPDMHGRSVGQAAAEEGRKRWASAGREAIAYIPTREGFDTADVGARKT
jgi:hypothetical protein